MTDRPAPEAKDAMLPVEVKMSQRQVDAMGSSLREAFVAIDAHHRPIALKVSLVNLFGEVEDCVLPLRMKRRWLRRHERELAAERAAVPSPEPSGPKGNEK